MISLTGFQPSIEQAFISMREKNFVPLLLDDFYKPRDSFTTSTSRDFQNARESCRKANLVESALNQGQYYIYISPCLVWCEIGFATGALISGSSSFEFYCNILIYKNAMLLHFFPKLK